MNFPPTREHVALGPGVRNAYGYGMCVECGGSGELGDDGLCLACQPCPACGSGCGFGWCETLGQQTPD